MNLEPSSMVRQAQPTQQGAIGFYPPGAHRSPKLGRDPVRRPLTWNIRTKSNHPVDPSFDRHSLVVLPDLHERRGVRVSMEASFLTYGIPAAPVGRAERRPPVSSCSAFCGGGWWCGCAIVRNIDAVLSPTAMKTVLMGRSGRRRRGKVRVLVRVQYVPNDRSTVMAFADLWLQVAMMNQTKSKAATSETISTVVMVVATSNHRWGRTSAPSAAILSLDKGL